jgi:uncharacterized protein with HEPN domain
MPAKDPRLYLIHIRCDRILQYTTGIEEVWPTVPVVHDAVCRNLEIIGEAARRCDEEFRAPHPDVPRRSMTDVRNILIHAYDRVAPEILVHIVTKDIPPLPASVKHILGGDSEGR